MITWWKTLPNSLTSGVLLAVKAGIAGVMGALVAGVTSGSLFSDFNVNANSSFLIVVVTAIVLGVDQWLRVHNYEAKQPKSSDATGPQG